MSAGEKKNRGWVRCKESFGDLFLKNQYYTADYEASTSEIVLISELGGKVGFRIDGFFRYFAPQVHHKRNRHENTGP